MADNKNAKYVPGGRYSTSLALIGGLANNLQNMYQLAEIKRKNLTEEAFKQDAIDYVRAGYTETERQTHSKIIAQREAEEKYGVKGIAKAFIEDGKIVYKPYQLNDEEFKLWRKQNGVVDDAATTTTPVSNTTTDIDNQDNTGDKALSWFDKFTTSYSPEGKRVAEKLYNQLDSSSKSILENNINDQEVFDKYFSNFHSIHDVFGFTNDEQTNNVVFAINDARRNFLRNEDNQNEILWYLDDYLKDKDDDHVLNLLKEHGRYLYNPDQLAILDTYNDELKDAAFNPFITDYKKYGRFGSDFAEQLARKKDFFGHWYYSPFKNRFTNTGGNQGTTNQPASPLIFNTPNNDASNNNDNKSKIEFYRPESPFANKLFAEAEKARVEKKAKMEFNSNFFTTHDYDYKKDIEDYKYDVPSQFRQSNWFNYDDARYSIKGIANKYYTNGIHSLDKKELELLKYAKNYGDMISIFDDNDFNKEDKLKINNGINSLSNENFLALIDPDLNFATHIPTKEKNSGGDFYVLDNPNLFIKASIKRDSYISNNPHASDYFINTFDFEADNSWRGLFSSKELLVPTQEGKLRNAYYSSVQKVMKPIFETFKYPVVTSGYKKSGFFDFSGEYEKYDKLNEQDVSVFTIQPQIYANEQGVDNVDALYNAVRMFNAIDNLNLPIKSSTLKIENGLPYIELTHSYSQKDNKNSEKFIEIDIDLLDGIDRVASGIPSHILNQIKISFINKKKSITFSDRAFSYVANYVYDKFARTSYNMTITEKPDEAKYINFIGELNRFEKIAGDYKKVIPLPSIGGF